MSCPYVAPQQQQVQQYDPALQQCMQQFSANAAELPVYQNYQQPYGYPVIIYINGQPTLSDGNETSEEDLNQITTDPKKDDDPWVGSIGFKASMKSSVENRNFEVAYKILDDPSFHDFAKEAYESEGGYAIRVNEMTGEKEMFVAGTRKASQWVLNFWDAYNYLSGSNMKAFNIWRTGKISELENVARANDIDVIYGHSRGGALVADMDLPETVTKVGLDAAMVLTDNKDMINFNEGGAGNRGGWFDKMIGFGGENNVTMDTSPDKFHNVW